MPSPFVAGRKAPDWFVSAFKSKRTAAHLEWMKRNGVTEGSLRSRAYSVFLTVAAIGAAVVVLSSVLLGIQVLAYLLVPTLLILVILPSRSTGSPAASIKGKGWTCCANPPP